jgi:hypothetical protein
VFWSPVLLLLSEETPTAVLNSPCVLNWSALAPIAVLLLAVLLLSAKAPLAVLATPTVLLESA